MASTVNKTMGSISGRVTVPLGGADRPLKSVRVDLYRFTFGADGAPRFERMNQVSARTDASGQFSFSDPRDLQVPVQVRLVASGLPPYTPIERVLVKSLPSLAFRISADAELLSHGGAPAGSEFIDVHDERLGVTTAWAAGNPTRVQVPLSGASGLEIRIDAGNKEAALLAGTGADAVGSLLGTQVHLLRIGRATREDVAELADTRPAWAGKAGYMTSAPGAFFPGVHDAAFAGTLHVGGHFGGGLLALGDNLHYAMSFARYSGSPGAPYDPTHLGAPTPIVNPLVNKRYILPTGPSDPGKWQMLNLGPFDGAITAVDAGLDPSAIGTSVQVFRRPSLPNPLVEYYPFWDLLTTWDSSLAPDELIVLRIEVYEKTGGTADRPHLTLRSITSSVNSHLPLQIDNRPPVPRLLGLNVGTATIAAPLSLLSSTAMDACGNLRVTPGGSAERNECVVARYSIEDGSGAAHKHVASYGMAVDYSPRGSLGETSVSLVPGGYPSPLHAISGAYVPATSPIFSVFDQQSVLVPIAPDGWPPESGDGPTSCPQYAAAVRLTCSVRAVDGFAFAFGTPSLRRYIIISR